MMAPRATAATHSVPFPSASGRLDVRKEQAEEKKEEEEEGDDFNGRMGKSMSTLLSPSLSAASWQLAVAAAAFDRRHPLQYVRPRCGG